MGTANRQRSNTRRVFCTHCGRENEVGQRAMSVFCSHCRKRLILEDYKIDFYHAVRSFATCGSVVVEKRGLISAPIQVQNLTVKGKVKGDVRARGRVQVTGTGELRGDITAPLLVVEGGGLIQGYCRIGIPEDGARAL